MKTALIAGKHSHIYNGIKPMMQAEGWEILEYPQTGKWDVFISFIGQVAPVGNWWELPFPAIEDCISSNLLYPLDLLHRSWSMRNENATVLLFAGSNPQKIMNGYLPYNVGKMALIKAVEQLDSETPDAKFIAFGPGYVRASPIHNATHEANWPNERIARGDAGTPMEKIWEAMKWCIEQPKSNVGGRNIAVSDMPGGGLNLVLADDDTFKLRRVQ